MSALDDLPPGFDRHADALAIVEVGACNPSGVSLTLHHACRQAIAEGAPQRSTTPPSGSSDYSSHFSSTSAASSIPSSTPA